MFAVLSGWFFTLRPCQACSATLFSTICALLKRRRLSIAFFAILRQRLTFSMLLQKDYRSHHCQIHLHLLLPLVYLEPDM